MNIFIKVRFFHNYKGWVDWSTALESDGPYFRNHGTMIWAHLKSEVPDLTASLDAVRSDSSLFV